MPLPLSGAEWPPKQLAPITAKQAEWDAWYVGDPDRLTDTYRGQARGEDAGGCSRREARMVTERERIAEEIAKVRAEQKRLPAHWVEKREMLAQRLEDLVNDLLACK